MALADADDPALQADVHRLPPGRLAEVGIVGPAVAELGDPGDAATRREALADEKEVGGGLLA